ncbi:MAG: hypothetical protein K2N28_07340 [Muribaculaceae bacterium]|nr:hypothetical protein [Muribaculaceae bacterium]
MFNKSKISLILAAFLTCGMCFAGNSDQSVEEVVHLRPIKRYSVFEARKFYPGEIVIVEGSSNGNIIFGGDILKTDNEGLTDYKRKREIPVSELRARNIDYNQMFSVLDSIDLIVNLTELNDDSIRIFHFNDSIGRIFKKGQRDTIALASWNGLMLEQSLRIVRDSFPSEELALSSLNFITTPNEPKADIADSDAPNTNNEAVGEKFKESWPWLVLILVILGFGCYGLLFVVRKRRSAAKPIEENCEVPSEESSEEYRDIPFPDGEDPDSKPYIEPETVDYSWEYKKLKSDYSALEKEYDKAKNQLQKANSDLKEEKAKRDEIVKEEKTKIQNEANIQIAKVRENAKNEINKAWENVEKAEKKAADANKRADGIKAELNDKFNKERDQFKNRINALDVEKTNLTRDLTTTSRNLAEEKNAHGITKHRVEQLTAETMAFKEKITGVSDARNYCSHIVRLIELARKIEDTAAKTLESGLSDPYFVYKALALFNAKTSTLDMAAFYTDVEMIAKTGFVIKGTPMGTYSEVSNPRDFEEKTKIYFFTTYLKTYIDALVVLNESLSGLQYLVDDIKPSLVRDFNEYRGALNRTLDGLGIKVLTVKVWDSVGVNIDLLATEIDAGYEKHGAILEIENCKVSLIGGKEDERRIHVKIQK